MKKLFLSMLAAVTLFASCSQEEIVTKTEGESLVSFTVTTPELGSRAVGDGTTADKLYYAVYDEKGNIVTNVSNTVGQNFEMSDNVTLHLLNGETYSILFWARNKDCAAIFDPVNRTLSVPTTMESNKEAYDAFYAYVAPFTVVGSKQETVKMYRPFAQMNIATTVRDITGVNAYFNTAVAKSQLKVNAATKMDLTTGVVSEYMDLTYAYADFLTETFPVAGSYNYLSMNYLLVGADKELKTITLELADLQGAEVIEKSFENIPVQRNYRTNVYGNLFTSQTDWSVALLPEFNGTYTILSGDVKLENDLVIENTLLVNKGDVVLDLNGKSIINKKENASTDVIIVSEGATLTINGEGTIEAVTGNDGFTIISEGTLTINGGTYKSGVDANGDPNAVIYARGNGKVYVNGGNFPNDNKSKFVLNKKDADRATTIIEVRGGTFGCFDPNNNAAENPGTDFMPEGYKSTNIGTTEMPVYQVSIDMNVTAGATATLTSDAGISTRLTVDGGTLDGAGHSLIVAENPEDNYLVYGKGEASIKNVKIEGENQKAAGDKSTRAMMFEQIGDIVVDNVHISGVGYALNVNCASTNPVHTLTVSNSTLNGWSSFGTAVKEATFTNVSFGMSTYYEAGSMWNGGIRPYSTVTFVDCDFAEGFKVDVYHEDDKGNPCIPAVKFVNCKYADQDITSTSALFESGDFAKANVTIQ